MAGGVLPSCLQADGDGTRISVRVVPRASTSEICGMHGDALKVRLQAPPVDGKANKALCAFIAEALGVPVRAVSLVAGATGRDKTLLAAGISPAETAQRLSLGG